MSENPALPSKSVASALSSPKVALIGCGAIAEKFYLPALLRHPSVMKSLILVDPNQARVRELATEFNVTNYLVDYREVLSQGLEGAIVATPTALHYPISMEFLSRAVHVLCEKPLADSADKAREMVKEAQKTGATISVNHTRRLYASNLEVKELLKSRALGEPLLIKYFQGEEFDWPTVSGFYFDSKSSHRGVLLDQGVHVLDLICWWLEGKPKLVSCENDSFGGCEAVAQVQFEHNRCVGEVRISLLGKTPCSYMVKCEAGTVQGDVYDSQSLVLTTKSGRKKKIKLKSDVKYYSDRAYKLVTNFLNVISKGEAPLISAHDVLDSLELIDEYYEIASRFDMPWYEIPELQK